VPDRVTFASRWREARPSKTALFWSCVACIIATMIVGFTWGGWVTGGTARSIASRAADDARTKLAAAICVNRFESASDAQAELAKLKGTSAWQQDDFIVKGGWATLPGMKEPFAGVADLCAHQLTSEKSTSSTTTSG
jgi:hypothetical protein